MVDAQNDYVMGSISSGSESLIHLRTV